MFGINNIDADFDVTANIKQPALICFIKNKSVSDEFLMSYFILKPVNTLQALSFFKRPDLMFKTLTGE
ncbi:MULTISPECIES: hypothetical protein [Flavobacterium]|uniref:Uncharacterized protein n=1 Tax=Flavobacterium hydatis TaxID=991 RepID=A0A086AIN3_FLAHY|nr:MULTISPECIES: hypothetical protein [Flavobacterium]KFF16547.1 hypothetical protein IW20_10280 [Flavobacterium hydatis]OXA90206.1 hypothetical protein B0A62_19220 [Flavobacterium hydatis]OXE99883.1 hypothetical protein B0A63_11325 [Flavobacterium johnsoniae UW101]WQG82400.1 hypothetical protein SR927_04630 [Flavobacterium johnsoniae UW101]